MLKNEIMNFSNKIIWITGASYGIGKALVIERSNQKAKIILSSRRKQDLELVNNACKTQLK
jgi:short-subunit dehydrogenase